MKAANILYAAHNRDGYMHMLASKKFNNLFKNKKNTYISCAIACQYWPEQAPESRGFSFLDANFHE